jgi:dihydroorotate dehydrogenase
MWRLLRPLLFALPPETAHHLGMARLAMSSGGGRPADPPVLATTVAGLSFPNCLGLAAGLDKNAEAVAGLFSLGFGFVEVGTVTPRAQPGNPPPRLFRVPEHEALINRMGFNNEGAEAMAGRLEKLKFRPGPLGINLGKNKDTPLEKAADDYAAAATRLAPFADYLVVNLSSPNTPGLRSLQEPEALEKIVRATIAAAGGKPVFVKIAPDLEDEAVDGAVDVIAGSGAKALIATNTTLARPFQHPRAAEAGGLSGRPLATRSTQVVRRAFKRAGGRLPIIGVGGVFDAEGAWEKIRAGASLVQLYTGFIYGGPGAPRQIIEGLAAKVAAAGLKSVADAVGADA